MTIELALTLEFFIIARIAGVEKSYYYDILKKEGQKPPGKLISPEDQKILCKIFRVPYFFPDMPDTNDLGRSRTHTDDLGQTV
jgi:hypothetical protein